MTTTLTPAQQLAVTTVDRSVGIIAGAGAGKTRVLVERCLHILAHTDTPLQRLLAITFTERAAAELRSRLAARLPADLRLAAHGAAITTFHGFCARVVREHAPRVGYSPRFRLLDAIETPQWQSRAIETTLLRGLEAGAPAWRELVALWEFRRVRDGLHALLDDRWNMSQWMAATDLARLLPLERAALHAFTACDAAYAAMKQAQHVADFHDLEILSLRLFETHPEILSDYQRRFRHLLVDEFQDTNPIQMALIQRLFTPPDNILCVVGDPKQSIYRFRGAEVRCFHTMLDGIAAAGGEIIHLRENFRSAARVVQFINAACPDIPAAEQLIAATGGPDDGAVEWLPLALPDAGGRAQRRESEAEAVAARIAALVANEGVRHGEIACIFPTRLGLPPLVAALQRGGVPFHRYQGGTLLQRREVQDLLLAARCLAGLAARTYDDAVLLGLLRSPLIGLTADECYRLVHLPEHPASAEAVDWPPLHRAAWANPALAMLLQHWQLLLPHCTTAEMLRAIIASTDYDAVLAGLDPTGQANANVERLCTLAETAPEHQTLDLAQFVESMHDLAEREARLDDQPVQLAGDDAVQLLTIHAAKGTEFRVVFLLDTAATPASRFPAWGFLPGVGFALRPHTPPGEPPPKATDDPNTPWGALKVFNADADAAERERLLYVALTRAAERIIVPLPPLPENDAPDTPAKDWATRLARTCQGLGIKHRGSTLGSESRRAQEDSTMHNPASRDGTSSSPFSLWGEGWDEGEDARGASAGWSPPHPSPLPKGRGGPRVTRSACALHAVQTPLHISVTELEVLARCPQEYYLRYRLGLPGTLEWPDPAGLHEPLRGAVVHAVLARALQEPTRSLTDIAREELRIRGVEPALAQHRELQHLLNNFAASESATPATTVAELPFHLFLTDASVSAIVSGAIDLLRQTDDGWEIVDYKTDRIATTAEAQAHATRYAVQMAVYALAAHDAGYRPLHRTKLRFLTTNTAVSTPSTDDTRSATREALRTLLRTLAAEDFTLAPDTAPPCAGCAYGRNRLCAMARPSTLLG